MPLLPFAVGLLAGVFTVRLTRNNKARTSFDKAQARLRDATVSGLTVIESSSARLRDKLAAGEPADMTPAPLPAVGVEAEAAPVARPPRKRAQRKPAANTKAEPVAKPEPAGDAS